MNKYHCLGLGIVGVVVLDLAAIIVLHEDGYLILGAAAIIGTLVGLAFNAKFSMPAIAKPADDEKAAKHGE